MVESQLRTNKVTDTRILEAFETVPRERFLPEGRSGVAYIDEDLPVAPGRYLMEPMILARLLQAAEIAPGDIVLDIGCASGYSCAILARLADTVVALEADEALSQQAETALQDLVIDNAVVVQGDLTQGYAKQAPYNVILLGGAVAAVPERLDPADVLLIRPEAYDARAGTLPMRQGMRVGTASARRRARTRTCALPHGARRQSQPRRSPHRAPAPHIRQAGE